MKYFFTLIATILCANLLASSPKLELKIEDHKFSQTALIVNYFSVASNNNVSKLKFTKPANISETKHSVVYINQPFFNLNKALQNNVRTLEQEAGYQLKQSADLQLIGIGLQGLGVILTSIGSISSSVGNNNSTVAGGLVIGSICILGGLGCKIAAIFKKRQAGILLEMSETK